MKIISHLNLTIQVFAHFVIFGFNGFLLFNISQGAKKILCCELTIPYSVLTSLKKNSDAIYLSVLGIAAGMGTQVHHSAPMRLVFLTDIWSKVKPYLRPEGIAAIEKKGTSVVDFENEKVTPLIGNEECAYTNKKGDIFLCGIEQAWSDGKISFRKPLSCHLFPIRIKYYSDFRAVNYEELAICSPARVAGDREGIYVYEFLKEPLIRALG